MDKEKNRRSAKLGMDGKRDMLDSVSDLDSAAIKTRTLGIVDGTFDVSATVRGRGRIRAKADEKSPLVFKISHYISPTTTPLVFHWSRNFFGSSFYHTEAAFQCFSVVHSGWRRRWATTPFA